MIEYVVGVMEMVENKSEVDLETEIISASKWSIVTETMSKLISPITNMILARILTPEIFGAVVTVNMVTSFADMVTNTGFQKYLIQHEYKNNEEENYSLSVAFWANFILSIVFWIVICIYSKNIAKLLGNINLNLAISIASVQIPISSFSSIQIAVYRRKFDFKTLFWVRTITVLVPFVVTIPLAVSGCGYWSLIIGSLCGLILSAIIMTIKSEWKPQFIFRIYILKKMLKYSTWSTVDAVALWLENWVDAFIVGSFISTFYLGIYKTSLNTVNSIYATVTAAIAPVLFSALSRCQNDENLFKRTFINIQTNVAYILFPLGTGIFICSELVTKILLGSQWHEASRIIGIWALTMALITTIANFNSDAFRAAGRPDVSFLVELITTIFVVLVCSISVKKGFWALVYARALVTFINPIISYIFMKKIVNIGYADVFKAIIKPFICTLIMGIVLSILKFYLNSLIGNVIAIGISVLIYILTVYLISRKDFYNILNLIHK